MDDGRTVAVAGAKQRALLAMLLLHANDVVSADRLMDALWGDEPPETAKNALQVHVSQLRKALGNDVVERRRPGLRDRGRLRRSRPGPLRGAVRGGRSRSRPRRAPSGSGRRSRSGAASRSSTGSGWRSCGWPRWRTGSTSTSSSAATPR